MTKIRSILKSSAHADGKRQILLLLSDRGKREYFSTGFSATPREFDQTEGRFIQGRGVSSFRLERFCTNQVNIIT